MTVETVREMYGSGIVAIGDFIVAQNCNIFTFWAAYSSFDENYRGTLREGLLCDFVALSDNPLTIPVEKPDTLAIDSVYFRGKRYEPKKRGLATLLWKAIAGRR